MIYTDKKKPRSFFLKYDDLINSNPIIVSIEEAKKTFSSFGYNLNPGHPDLNLVDLKEVVVDGHSYKIAGHLHLGEEAIERIDRVVGAHFKNNDREIEENHLKKG